VILHNIISYLDSFLRTQFNAEAGTKFLFAIRLRHSWIWWYYVSNV